jgi:hypothetical protein
MPPKPGAETPKVETPKVKPNPKRICFTNGLAKEGGRPIQGVYETYFPNTPSREITHEPTHIFEDPEESEMALVAWTSDAFDAEQRPHVFFCEGGVEKMLFELVGQKGDRRIKLELAPPHDGAPRRCYVYFAFVKCGSRG